MAFRASSLKNGYSRNAGRRWRAADIAELRQLVRRGADLRAIGLKLGRPDSAIRAKASALGLEIERHSEGADASGSTMHARAAGVRPFAPRSSAPRGPSMGGHQASRAMPVSNARSAKPAQLELFG